MSEINYREYIEANTIRCEASYRGGGIEIDCTGLFPYLEEARMTAYQNYLGGGMLGSIQSSNDFEADLKSGDSETFEALQDTLKRYFHDLTNHEDDEWESASYEDNQNRPESAY